MTYDQQYDDLNSLISDLIQQNKELTNLIGDLYLRIDEITAEGNTKND